MTEIRAVAFEESDGEKIVTLLQCLEHDICTQGRNQGHAVSRMCGAIMANREVNEKLGRKGLNGIPCAPKKFFDMWDETPDRREKFDDQGRWCFP